MSRRLLAAATASGPVARELAAGGVDVVVAYHSSAYRQRGLPSVAGLLPWVNANDQTAAFLPEVVAAAGDRPVLATVCANDGLRDLDAVLAGARAAGATGVLNAPTTGLFTGPVRAALEHAGLGSTAEIDLIRRARGAGLDGWCYVFDAEWTARAIEAGAAALVVHLGITGPGGPSPLPVAAECLRAAAGSGIPVLLHGGPVRRPDDLARLLDELDDAEPAPGFLGASALENDPDGAGPRSAAARWRAALDARPDRERIGR